MQGMASTIDDARARESLLDAICSGHGSRVAEEACALVAAKKDAVVRRLCQECCAMCSPEHCLAMILFLLHKPKLGKKHATEESAWLADGIATVVSGARATRGGRDALGTASGSGPGSGQRNHAKIRQMIAAIEKAAARGRTIVKGSGATETDVERTRADRRGAREDARFAEALGSLPAKPGDKWNPVMNLIDIAYRHDVVQVPLIRNEKFRRLVMRARGATGASAAATGCSMGASAADGTPSLRTPATEAARPAGRGDGDDEGGAHVADDPHLKMAALWTFDRTMIPRTCIDGNQIPCADDIDVPAPKVVHCSGDAKKGRKGNAKDRVTCVLVDETEDTHDDAHNAC
jgi:hypothetical protein